MRDPHKTQISDLVFNFFDKAQKLYHLGAAVSASQTD